MKKSIKTFLAAGLALATMAGLTACGSDSNSGAATTSNGKSVQEQTSGLNMKRSIPMSKLRKRLHRDLMTPVPPSTRLFRLGPTPMTSMQWI